MEGFSSGSPLLLLNATEDIARSRECSQAFGRHARVSDAAPGTLPPFHQENRKQSSAQSPNPRRNSVERSCVHRRLQYYVHSGIKGPASGESFKAGVLALKCHRAAGATPPSTLPAPQPTSASFGPRRPPRRQKATGACRIFLTVVVAPRRLRT